MHMADALLSPTVGTVLWAGTVAVGGVASQKLKERIDDRLIPLMGVLGAFIFAAQMINFTIPGTGSSGHLVGGMLLAILLGPHAAFLALASVLTVQALFFADGGLLALGCNIWNLGFYPCYLVYLLLYKPLAGEERHSGRVTIACILSAVAALQLGAFSVVLETLLSGRSELPFGAFALLMQPIHLAIGIVEGVVTAGIIGFIRAARPETFAAITGRPVPSPVSRGQILILFAILTVFTGGSLSWFASTHPDGLEWAIEKMTGREELPEPGNGITAALKDLQGKTAFLPDYGFKAAKSSPQHDSGTPVHPRIDPATSVAGMTGAAIVLCLIGIIGLTIRSVRMRKKDEKTIS
ncbi:MAG: energy-coupling factor ABC transporter permease [Deltaproteobacteria bacterium]|nr:energy-coupling factor ABC transporter permease [Deltaproteobacteria bacterium]